MDIIEEVGYVIASSYRTKVLKSIAKSPNIPTKISEDSGIIINHISNVLRQLESHKLIYCINPEMRKGRVYKITECGHLVVNKIEK